MKTMCFILFGLLLCLACSSAGDDPDSPHTYERTIIFETSPGEAPHGFLPQCRPSHTIEFALGLGQDFKAAKDSLNNGLTYAPSIGYFRALNDGKLVFLNRMVGIIVILDPVAGKYYTFSPAVEAYPGLSDIWVGAHDEIFALLFNITENDTDSVAVAAPESTSGPSSPSISHKVAFRLFKYLPISDGYILDTDFDIAEFELPPQYIRISPKNHIYFRNCVDRSSRLDITTVFDENGRFIKNTLAQGETCDGREFLVHSRSRENFTTSFLDWLLNNGSIEIMTWPENKRLLIVKLDHPFGSTNFKATCDGRLLMYAHSEWRSALSDGDVLAVDIPLVVIKDLANGDITKIDLSDCRREGFDYFSISDVSLNYLGEIYAVAVYFNYKEGQFGDEKIVLYRWRRNPGS